MTDKETYAPYSKWEYLTDVETCQAYIREQDAEIKRLLSAINKAYLLSNEPRVMKILRAALKQKDTTDE